MEESSDLHRRTPRVMRITCDRIFYSGLLGKPAARVYGAWMLYLAREGPIRVAIDGGAWEGGLLAIVPPYRQHRIQNSGRTISVVLVEPESVTAAAMPVWTRGGIVEDTAVLRRLRNGSEALLASSGNDYVETSSFDRLFFGAELTPRNLDPRIASVVKQIYDDPSQPYVAADLAAASNLSYSRFLHLFAQECGVAFRAFRAWRRARNLLCHVRGYSNLTYLALQMGYPDATYFSHSIRRIYGLAPRDIIVGSRRLIVFGEQVPRSWAFR